MTQSKIYHIAKKIKSYGRYEITVELEDGTEIKKDTTDMEMIDNWDAEKNNFAERMVEDYYEEN